MLERLKVKGIYYNNQHKQLQHMQLFNNDISISLAAKSTGFHLLLLHPCLLTFTYILSGEYFLQTYYIT